MSRRVPRLFGLALLIAQVVACKSSADYSSAATDALADGRLDVAEEALRDGLEAHPDDVALLRQTAEFYLDRASRDSYKPRLGLHYAMRADKAARGADPDIARLLLRAYREAGGFAERDALVRQGLETVRHRDAAAPQALDAVPPELANPTLPNFIAEGKRKEAARNAEQPCPRRYVLVPGGLYPRVGDAAIALGDVCVEQRIATPEPHRGDVPGLAEAVCRSQGARPCTADEKAIACGPLLPAIGDHPSCRDPLVPRCCL
jgi:hypothetical protein